MKGDGAPLIARIQYPPPRRRSLLEIDKIFSAAASSIDDMTNDECKRERRVGKLNENYYQDSADSKVSSGDI